MTVHSSRLQALTGPERWGLVRVAVLFGKPMKLRCQTCITGDLLLDEQTGLIFVFIAREGEALHLDLYEE